MSTDRTGRTSPATLYDVAQEAGVSLATASRALNGSTRRVKDGYRNRVLAAAAKLGYTPNLSAQAVARGGTNTVALVVSDITDLSFSSIAAGVIRAAAPHGLLVTTAMSERNSDREIELVRVLRGQRPRVIIISGSRLTNDSNHTALIAELDAFQRTGGRVVMISQSELPFDTVLIDNTSGARDLARELIDLGYRRFAVLAGPQNLVTARDRVAAFTAELASAEITIPTGYLVHSGFTRDGGYEAMSAVLDRGIDDIEIAFAVSDVMALGAMAALRDRQVAVPGDIAIAGYDDIATARDVTPALTTVHVPLEKAGERAIALAVQELGAQPQVELISVTVAVRASTPLLPSRAARRPSPS